MYNVLLMFLLHVMILRIMNMTSLIRRHSDRMWLIPSGTILLENNILCAMVHLCPIQATTGNIGATRALPQCLWSLTAISTARMPQMSSDEVVNLVPHPINCGLVAINPNSLCVQRFPHNEFVAMTNIRCIFAFDTQLSFIKAQGELFGFAIIDVPTIILIYTMT